MRLIMLMNTLLIKINTERIMMKKQEEIFNMILKKKNV